MRKKNNLENNLLRNLRTDMARECIFRASGGTNFENFLTRRQRWWHLYGFHVFTGLPEKLWIYHWQQTNTLSKSALKTSNQIPKISHLMPFWCLHYFV